MRTLYWLNLVSSLLVASIAQADSPPQAEAAQPAPQAAQSIPQAAQPVVTAPAAPMPNPWMNQAGLPFPALPLPTLPALPLPGFPVANNPWISQMPQQTSGALPFSFLPYMLPNMMPTLGPAQPRKPYTMHQVIPEEVKQQMMQMMMPMMTGMMRMTMPEAMNWFAYKIKAKPGLSFDDVVESMKLRANQLNFKHVSENLMWKDFQAVLGDKEAPRIEVHSFCDIRVGRDLLKLSPEFLVFLPCRIAVMEDADKNIWVMMLDWDMTWVAGYEQKMGLSMELTKGAWELRQKMGEIMKAGANGDL